MNVLTGARPRVTGPDLHAALLASDSATAVLESLCGAPVTIRRCQSPPVALLPTALAPAGIVHRHVSLVCGAQTLSHADLWFRADLLPADMVTALARTDAPFGRVVRPLGLRRHMLTYRLHAPGSPCALEHRALLRNEAGQDVAEVWERYSWDLVAGS